MRAADEDPGHGAVTPRLAAGQPIRSRWPVHEEDEIGAAAEVLRSGRVNALVHGEHCRAFEEAFARYVGVEHAIAVSNGTLALELGLRALGIGAGDEVIVTARSFFASAACIVACGARPVFVDVGRDSQNMAPEAIEAAITVRTRAILCVHLAGRPCDMGRIVDICIRNDLKLIEDCAQAHGAALDGRRVGSFGDVAAFSFCTDKIMSTGGEGGMLLIREPAIWRRAWAYKDHGKNVDKARGPRPAGSTFRWLHDSFGSNYRMTEMQAAIGLIQLGKLPGWLARRRANAHVLIDRLGELPGVRVPVPPGGVEHAYYKAYLFVGPAGCVEPGHRDALVAALIGRGVPAGSGSCPEMYLERLPRHRARAAASVARGAGVGCDEPDAARRPYAGAGRHARHGGDRRGGRRRLRGAARGGLTHRVGPYPFAPAPIRSCRSVLCHLG